MLELKLAQRFQKVAIAVFSLKVLVFKIAEKLKTPPHTHWATFTRNYYSKSGHTVHKQKMETRR